jgi:drug/metabolite transporter (DMT)-like permease
MATAAGLAAIAMWALLALLTDLTGTIPPFQLNAMTFTLGTAVGLAMLAMRGTARTLLALPGTVWLTGILGLFGYHFLYFTALRNAPAVDASLVAYLWPLFIVLGSALLPGEKLRWFHVAGAIAGLAGATLIVTRSGAFGFDPRFAFGYAMALLCAITWAAYSLASRRFAAVPSDAVTGYCAATALLSLLCHRAFETTVWPADGVQWLAVLGLGLMPVGAAFYLWDHGVKHGRIQLLGVASYAAPLLSTLALIGAGRAQLTAAIAAACALIAGGAMLASSDIIVRAMQRNGAQAGRG